MLSAHQVVHRFGSTLALAGVDFAVSAGEIVGLAGANGAGKSTLIGILSGAFRPTGGELRVDGSPVVFADPEAAASSGIATVQQDVDAALVPTLTVAENLVLDRIAAGHIRRFAGPRTIRRAAAEVLGNLPLDLDAPVSQLRTSEKQQLLIARALHRGARVLILDEPTAALSVGEQRDLHVRLLELAARGTAVIYITHHLGEMATICSRVVALRGGRVAGEFPGTPFPQQDVVRAMLGDLAAQGPPSGSPTLAGTPILRATEVRARAEWSALNFEVHRGEVLGITGLLGAGKTELLRQLAGADRLVSGALEFDGKPYTPRHPADAVTAGIGFVAEDRRQAAEFPDWDVAANLTVANLRSDASWPADQPPPRKSRRPTCDHRPAYRGIRS